MSRNLTLRIASSLLLIPVVLTALVAGGWMFGVFVAVAFGLAVGEWVDLARKIDHRGGIFIAGLVYLSLSFVMFCELRMSGDNGLYHVLTLMLVIWASDTVAYIFGRVFGGPKLAPTISPNKTWSGLVGAQVGAAGMFSLMVALSGALATVVPNTLGPNNMIPVLFYGLLLGFVGQVGDLLESLMKRRAGVKDSGRLIPGHGGILDRIDALLLMIPVYYVICIYGLSQ